MKFIILIFSLFIFSYTLKAQEVNKIYEITLKDGSIIKGKIVDMNIQFWTIETEAIGIIQISFEKIESFKSLETSRIPQQTIILQDTINPVSEKYLFMPSAFNLDKQTGSYSNTWFFMNGFDYGILNNWSIGTSVFMPIIPIAISIHTKYSLSISPKTRLAFQVDYFATTFIENAESAFLAQSMITFGNRKKNTTINVGRFFDRSLQGTNGVLVGISHISPINWRTFLVTQNQFIVFEDSSQLINPSLCLRLVRGEKLYDLGIMGLGVLDNLNGNAVIPLPYIGYHLAIGRRK